MSIKTNDTHDTPAPTTPPFAVIFDFDGVLFETEAVHCDAFARILADEGIALNWAEYATEYVGLSDREILSRLTVRHPNLRQTEPDNLLARKHQNYFELM